MKMHREIIQEETIIMKERKVCFSYGYLDLRKMTKVTTLPRDSPERATGVTRHQVGCAHQGEIGNGGG